MLSVSPWTIANDFDQSDTVLVDTVTPKSDIAPLASATATGGSNSLEISGAEPGSTLQFKQEGSPATEWTTWKFTGTNTTITGLKQGTYEIQFVDAQGKVTDSESGIVVTPSDTAAATALKVKAKVDNKAATLSTVTVSWAAPKKATAESNARYDVSYSIKVGKNWEEKGKFSTSDTKCIISGLQPGSSYRVTITALNADGNPGTNNKGKITSLVSVTAKTAKYVAVKKLTAKVVGEKVDLTWATHPHNATQGYEVWMSVKVKKVTTEVLLDTLYGGGTSSVSVSIATLKEKAGAASIDTDKNWKPTLQVRTIGEEQGTAVQSLFAKKAVTINVKKVTVTAFASPTKFQAEATDSGFDLTWNAVSGATGYEIQYKVAGSKADWTPFSGNPVTEAKATVGGLAADTVYEFQIIAKLDDKDSAPITTYAKTADVPDVAFAAPTDLAGVVASTSVALTWTAPDTEDTVTGYEVQYRKGSAAWQDWKVGGETIIAETKVTITGLDAETAYQFQVRAVYEVEGETKYSAWTDSLPATTLAAAAELGAPDNVQAVVTSSDTVTVTWTGVAGNNGYTVQYSTSSTFDSGNQTRNAAKDVTTFDIAGLTPGETYCFRVLTKGDGVDIADSGWSATATIELEKAGLPAPDNITATLKVGAERHTVTVNWESVPGNNGYTVQYSTSSTFASGNQTKDAAVGATSLDISGLTMGTRYYFRVMAKGDSTSTLDSGYSEEQPNVTTATSTQQQMDVSEFVGTFDMWSTDYGPGLGTQTDPNASAGATRPDDGGQWPTSNDGRQGGNLNWGNVKDASGNALLGVAYSVYWIRVYDTYQDEAPACVDVAGNLLMGTNAYGSRSGDNSQSFATDADNFTLSAREAQWQSLSFSRNGDEAFTLGSSYESGIEVVNLIPIGGENVHMDMNAVYYFLVVAECAGYDTEYTVIKHDLALPKLKDTTGKQFALNAEVKITDDAPGTPFTYGTATYPTLKETTITWNTGVDGGNSSVWYRVFYSTHPTQPPSTLASRSFTDDGSYLTGSLGAYNDGDYRFKTNPNNSTWNGGWCAIVSQAEYDKINTPSIKSVCIVGVYENGKLTVANLPENAFLVVVAEANGYQRVTSVHRVQVDKEEINLTATPTTTAGQVELAWHVPTTGNLDGLTYKVAVKKGGTALIEGADYLFTFGAGGATIDGLEAGTYTFEITAHAWAYLGGANNKALLTSSTSATVAVGAQKMTGTVTVTATPSATVGGQVAVTWTVPTVPATGVSYTVVVKKGATTLTAGKDFSVAYTGVNTATVNLPTADTYTIEVFAAAEGYVSTSGEKDVVITGKIVNPTLQNVRVQKVSNSAISIGWDAVASAFGLTNEDFDIQLSTDGGTTWLGSDGVVDVGLTYGGGTPRIQRNPPADAPPEAGRSITHANIIMLQPNMEYMIRIRAKATTNYDAGEWVTLPDSVKTVDHAAPTNIQPFDVTAITKTSETTVSVTLHWEKNTDRPDNPLIGYEIQYKEGSGSWTLYRNDGVSLIEGYTVTIQGLTLGATYQFQVRARATYGSGDSYVNYSSWQGTSDNTGASSNAVLTPQAVLPVVVVTGKAEKPGGWEVTVEWKADTTAEKYVIQWMKKETVPTPAEWTTPSASDSVEVSASELKAVIGGLEAGGSYWFRVQGTGVAGIATSRWSYAAYPILADAPLTVAKPELKLLGNSHSAVTLVWSDAGVIDAGYDLGNNGIKAHYSVAEGEKGEYLTGATPIMDTYFEIQYSIDNVNWYTLQVGGTSPRIRNGGGAFLSADSCNIIDLVAGNAYYFRMRVLETLNNNGTDWSNVVEVNLPTTAPISSAPTAPSGVSATAVSGGKTTINWTAPTPSGYEIVAYEVRYQTAAVPDGAAAGTWKSTMVFGEIVGGELVVPTTCVLDGLVDGVYNIQIRTHSNKGAGNDTWSGWSGSIPTPEA